MFRFANPEYLYLFILIPVFILGFIYLNLRKKKNVQKFGQLGLVKQMMPEMSLKRGYLKFWITLVALSFGVILIARPQFGTKMEKVEKEGIELVIAIDVSNSMLAQDVAPSRLARAKQLLTRLIENRLNDKVAIVVFAGEAYIQLPMTSDVQSAKMFLETINTDLVPVQGTAIGSAIDISMSCFGNDTGVDRAIVLITDGESHEGDAEAEAKRAAAAGIHVCVAGIGSTDGAYVPIKPGSTIMRKNSQGEFVLTKLNEEMCENIAEAGGGIYVHVDNTNNALNELLGFLNKLEKHELESFTYSEYDEKFIIFAWSMFALLFVEVLIFDKKNRIFKNVRIFK